MHQRPFKVLNIIAVPIFDFKL